MSLNVPIKASDAEARAMILQKMAKDKNLTMSDKRQLESQLSDYSKGYAKGGDVFTKPKLTPKQTKKVGSVMKEFKSGTLHSGKGGKVVKDPKQGIAIALSEASRMKKKK